MVRNRDIIIVGLQPWDNAIGSNCKNIAIEFAKHNRVLYVNHPLDRITVLKSSSNPQYQKHLDILKNKKDKLFAESIFLKSVGRTPLYNAIEDKNDEVVRLILEFNRKSMN